MEPLWISFAFVFGLLASWLSLPPLVGYLFAGFVLQFFGLQSTPALESISDLGITLLLFTIGLKLRVKSLIRPQIYATATLHMAASILLLMMRLAMVGFSSK